MWREIQSKVKKIFSRGFWMELQPSVAPWIWHLTLKAASSSPMIRPVSSTKSSTNNIDKSTHVRAFVTVIFFHGHSHLTRRYIHVMVYTLWITPCPEFRYTWIRLM